MSQKFSRHIAKTSQFPIGLNIRSGKGVYLYDDKGKEYIDMISGIAVSNLGHGNPAILKAIKEQIDKHLHVMVYGEFDEVPQRKLAEKLNDLLPEQLNCSYFTTSGSEAIEGALKLAKKFTGRKEIIAFKGAYHGSTLGALSLMGNNTLQKPFEPLLPNVKHLKYNDLNGLDGITKATAGVVVEPIQAASGCTVAEQKWMNALEKKCKESGVLLIFDEIQTGMGRTGKLFAFEHYGIVPDVLCIAKAFGGGLPIGAFISDKDIMDYLSVNPPLGHINTFGGNGVVCAAALAGLEVLENNPDLIDKAKTKGQLIRQLMQQSAIEKITGKGLMLALHFSSTEAAQTFIKNSLEQGIILIGHLFAEHTVRIAPPLVITEDEIIKACNTMLQLL